MKYKFACTSMIHVIFLPIKQPALNSTLFWPLSWKIYEPAPKHIKKDNTHTQTQKQHIILHLEGVVPTTPVRGVTYLPWLFSPLDVTGMIQPRSLGGEWLERPRHSALCRRSNGQKCPGGCLLGRIFWLSPKKKIGKCHNLKWVLCKFLTK